MLRGLKKELAFTRFQRVNAQTSFFILPAAKPPLRGLDRAPMLALLVGVAAYN